MLMLALRERLLQCGYMEAESSSKETPVWQPKQEDLRNVYEDYSPPAEKGYLFDAISDAVHSYGKIREWEPAGRFNLIMSIMGWVEIAEEAKKYLAADDETLKLLDDEAGAQLIVDKL